MIYNSDRIDSVAMAAGFNILFTLAGIMVLGALLMMAGVAITFWHFVAAFIISQVVCFGSCTRRAYVWSVILVLVLWIATGVFASFLADSNYDGNSHHQEMMLTLIRFPEDYNYYSFDTPPDYLKLWTYTYPKGMEFICAPLTALTGNVETGKASMMMLFLGTMFLAWGVLRKIFPQWNFKRLGCALLLVVCNPVVINEIFWLKDDGPLYYFPLLTILFSWLIIMEYHRKMAYIGLSAVIILAVSFKLNQFFYEGVTVLAVMAYMLLFRQTKELKRYFFVAAGGALFAALVINFHPYITNIVLYGHPFYPLMGEHTVDIMSRMKPEGIDPSWGRLGSFVYAHLCFHPGLFGILGGSFGKFSPLIFSLTFLLLVMYQVKIKKFTPVSYIVVVTILATFIFSECWWGRYIAFLWMIVPLAYIVWADSRRRVLRWLKGALLVIVFVNSAFIAVVNFYSCLSLTIHRKAIYDVLGGETVRVHNPKITSVWQLEYNNINIEGVQTPGDSLKAIPGDRAVPFYYGNTVFFPTLEVEPQQKARIDSLEENNPAIQFWYSCVNYYRRRRGVPELEPRWVQSPEPE